MTDNQRKEFQESLNKYFELLKQEEQPTENYNKIDLWFKNLFGRYTYAQSEDKKKYGLPEENMQKLREKLKEMNITEEEYVNAKGRRKKLQEILKEKQVEIIEVYTLEELIEQQEKYDKEINTLKSKHTERYKQMYQLTEEQYNLIGTELEKLKQKRKEVNTQIEQLKPNQIDKKEEVKEYNKKVLELKNIVKTQQQKIDELNTEKQHLEQEKKTIREEYSSKYERRLEKKSQEIKEEYIKKTDKAKEIIESQYKRKINEKEKQIEELNKQIKETNIKNHKQEKQKKEKQKDMIVKLLCTSSNLPIETIKNELKNKNLDSKNIKEVLKELKTELPGLTKKIDKQGNIFTYGITNNAKEEIDEYRKWEICQTISEIENGTIEFLVRSDMHMNMNSSEETIKKILYPYMNYSAKEGNIPIIDLGDLADTRRPYTMDDWEKQNKPAIKYAYNFYKNYAKVINTGADIKHYTLFGNHDTHPYLAGVDPLEIIYEYSNNFKLLGISQGEIKIGEDKIGVFHDKPWGNIVPFKEEHDKQIRDQRIYDYISNNINKTVNDYIYSLIGHYHFGAINSQEGFAVINNGIENTLLFTVEIKNKNIEKIYVTELYLFNNTVKKGGYQTEIYNKQKMLKK